MQTILEKVLNYIYTLVIFNALRLKSKHKTINLSKTIHFIKKFISCDQKGGWVNGETTQGLIPGQCQ